MADIPQQEPLDELQNKDVTASSYEPKDRPVQMSRRLRTTLSLEATEEETTPPISDDSVEPTTTTTTEKLPSGGTSGPPDSSDQSNKVSTDDFPSLTQILNSETQEQAVELMVKRSEAYQSLMAEASEMALSQKMLGKTIAEIEFSTTEITRGLNKTFAHEIALFPYIIGAINLRMLRQAVDGDKRGLN